MTADPKPSRPRYPNGRDPDAKGVSVYIDPETIAAVAQRTGPGDTRSGVLRLIVSRYAETMRRSLPELTATEWQLLREVINREWLPNGTLVALGLAREIEDVARLDPDAFARVNTWAADHGAPPVDGEAFVARLAAMPFAERLAIIDSVERWWRRENAESIASGLQRVLARGRMRRRERD